MTGRVVVRDLLSRIPIADAAFRRFFWSRVHFPENEMRFINNLSPGYLDIAVDVGAAQGSYSWILGRKFREVHAFEPGERHAQYMRMASRFSRVTLHECAVGATSARVPMYTPGDDSNALHSATLSGDNPVAKAGQVRVREVKQVTLDEFFAQPAFANRKIDLLKVDVEGYELDVFKGANSLLVAHRPIVVCEIEARHNVHYREVFGRLKLLGYRALAYMNGDFRAVEAEQVSLMQTEGALGVRLGRGYVPEKNEYINNFVFEHAQSRIKVGK